MACVLNGTYTFENVGQYLDSSIPNVNYSNYSVTFNEQELVYLGGDAEEGYFFAVGGTIEDAIYPTVTIWPEWGITAFAALGNPYNGEATVSICEKESDGSCPDVPFSESAPEQYADYFDEDGNFVPKASSGGDCDFTLATLSIVDENGEQSDKVPQLIGSVPLIYQGMLAVSPAFPPTYTDYQVPLYNGSLLIILDPTRIVSVSGDIESGSPYRIFGDATIAVYSDNIA